PLHPDRPILLPPVPPPPHRSTLFPYTTLFRSGWHTKAMPRASASGKCKPCKAPTGPSMVTGVSRTNKKDSQPPLGVNLSSGKYLDRKSTRLNSSHVSISYAVFCLKKKKIRSE